MNTDRDAPASGKARARIAYAIGIIIVGAAVAYVLVQRDLVSSLRSISPASAALAVGTAFVSAAVYGAQFGVSLRVFGMRLPYLQSLGLAVSNAMLNYVLPLKGGLLARAAYMKHTYRLSYTGYVSLMASSQLVAVATYGLGGGALLALSYARGDATPPLLIALFAASLLGSACLFALVEVIDFHRVKPRALGERLAAFSVGFPYWRRQMGLTLQYAALAGVGVTIQAIRLWIFFTALGFRAPLHLVLMISAAVAISATVSLTPGNLGIQEAVTAVSAGLLGIDPNTALLAGLLDRATGVLMAFALGLGFTPVLARARHARAGLETTDYQPPNGH